MLYINKMYNSIKNYYNLYLRVMKNFLNNIEKK